MRFFSSLNARKINPRGFTLLETMIALCITGFVALSIVTTIYQLQGIGNAHYAHIMSVKQVENAIHYMNRDIQQSQKIDFNTGGNWLTLSWTSFDNVQHQITYKFNNVVNNVGDLVRNDGTTNSTVAKCINTSPAFTSSSYDSASHKVTLQLTSTFKSGDKQNTETRNLSIIPRPGS